MIREEIKNQYKKEYCKKNECDGCTIDYENYIEWLENKIIELDKQILREI